MPYLKILPDTYILPKQKMLQYEECQFCGNENGFEYVKVTSTTTRYKHYDWRRVCGACRKTQAVIEKG